MAINAGCPSLSLLVNNLIVRWRARALLGYLCRHRAVCACVRTYTCVSALWTSQKVPVRVWYAHVRTHARRSVKWLTARTHTRARILNYPGVNINRGNDVPIANRCTNYANTAPRASLYLLPPCLPMYVCIYIHLYPPPSLSLSLMLACAYISRFPPSLSSTIRGTHIPYISTSIYIQISVSA